MYFLTRHAFLGVVDRFCFVLDLNRDRYLCLAREDLQALGPWLSGWQNEVPLSQCATSLPRPQEAETLIKHLIAAGLLTVTQRDGKPVTPTSMSPPMSTLETGRSAPKWALRQTLRFFTASNRARQSLRTKPLNETVRRVECRQTSCRSQNTPFDYDNASRYVAAFNALRPSFPEKYLCLFDSLALIEYLSAYKLFPRWVFGVQPDPFAAHCWVQEGTVVFNDSVERVATYTPIMVI